MSEYKTKIFEFARDATPEHHAILIQRFDELNACLERFVAIMAYLNPYMKNPIEEIETPVQGLCEECSNPCPNIKEGTLECKDYSEFIKTKCLSCVYWDVNTCSYSGACRDAEHYEALSEDELKKIAPVRV
jgi:hypothetical protein